MEEKRRKGIDSYLFRREKNGNKNFPSNLFNFRKIDTLTKNIH